MTTTQPGQEQRMVTDAMIEAGSRALCRAYEIDDGFSEKQADRAAAGAMGLNFKRPARNCYTAMEAARPTADLGEEGELVAALRKRAAWQRENLGDMLDHRTPYPELEQAADRLILYGEALADIASIDEAFIRANGTYAAFDKIVTRASAVLRSGG